MTSLLDDLCGHCAFLAGSGPWDGATVQVNSKLLKPVKVGAFMKVVGRVAQKDKRKVSITAELISESGEVQAELNYLP